MFLFNYFCHSRTLHPKDKYLSHIVYEKEKLGSTYREYVLSNILFFHFSPPYQMKIPRLSDLKCLLRLFNLLSAQLQSEIFSKEAQNYVKKLMWGQKEGVLVAVEG